MYIMETLYKNFHDDLIVVVPYERRPNLGTYRLKLHFGNRNNYGFFDPKNSQIGGNELDFHFGIDNGAWYVEIKEIQSSGHGNGTILLKAMLEHILEFERKNNVFVAYVKGWLSSMDSKNHWQVSIPFYLNFSNTLEDTNPWKNQLTAQIYLCDEKQPNKIGHKVNDVTQFMLDGNDGYIVYSRKR